MTDTQVKPKRDLFLLYSSLFPCHFYAGIDSGIEGYRGELRRNQGSPEHTFSNFQVFSNSFWGRACCSALTNDQPFFWLSKIRGGAYAVHYDPILLYAVWSGQPMADCFGHAVDVMPRA